MGKNDMQDSIKKYILETFLPDEDPASLTTETPLLTTGILDSIAALELVSFLEKSYAIKVKAHEVNIDNLNTINEIATFVRSKQS
jgi:acyl carrier protein